MEKARAWRDVAAVTVLAVYAHVLLEWLFFLTKPSFVAALGVGERLGLAVITPLPLAAASLVAVGIVGAVAPALAWLVPAAVLAACAFLLLDNFTYTLFHVGVGSAGGPGRAAYAVLFLGLLAGAYRTLRDRRLRHGRKVAALLLAISVGTAVWRSAAAAPAQPVAPATSVHARRPDVLILSGDGINAASMSAYGYERDTTPFIRSRMGDALVCEHAYPNANFSAASLVSMLTGKSPLRTGIRHHPPDILRGANAYEHLPGMLRRLGYHGLSLGLRPHTEPADLNMQGGFDVANFRKPPDIGRRLPASSALAFDAEQYFLAEIWERIADRVLHVVGLRTMSTAVAETGAPSPQYDRRRVAALLDFFAQSPRPVFAQVHLMGTHGPEVYPAFRHFARGAKRKSPRARYDDAVLEFDRHVAAIFAELGRRGTLRETLVVLTSDHAENWSFGRIPLMFFLPGGHPEGRIAANCQLLDVAPTVLDALGFSPPAWMDGASLLRTEPDPRRRIVSVVYRMPPGTNAPLPDSIALTACDRTYRLRDGVVSSRLLDDHPSCGSEARGDAKAVDRVLRALDRQWRAGAMTGTLQDAVEAAGETPSR